VASVDDTLASLVLDPAAKLELRVPVRWVDRGTSVRANLAVHNTYGVPVIVGMQITKDSPWKPTAYLMIHGVQLRRLDVNATHSNRTPDRERWSEAHGDAVAYTPDNIPPVPMRAIGGEHYRALWEAFLQECGISTTSAYAWSDPALANDGPPLFDGEA